MGTQQRLFTNEPVLGEVEEHFSTSGEHLLIGVDEAGRGPLAGPVVVAAVALPRGAVIAGLDDSKKLTEARREALYPIVQATAIAWSVHEIQPATIDAINILQATFEGMRRVARDVLAALGAAGLEPDRVVVDGNKTIPWVGDDPPRQSAVVKGDRRSRNIAAASILAKVHRDRVMVAFDGLFPGYGFAQHKGYPTVAHRAAVAALGPTRIHRQSFKLSRDEP